MKGTKNTIHEDRSLTISDSKVSCVTGFVGAKETSVLENIVGFKLFGTEPEVMISCYLFLELYAGWYVAIWLRGVEFWPSISKDNSRTRLVVGKSLVAGEFVQLSPLRFVIPDRC
ncbi:hypothetical protein V6N13_036277 [Hibiscus sabdariffa]